MVVLMCALMALMLHKIANKNSSWQAVLRWPWFVFFPRENADGSLLHRDIASQQQHASSHKALFAGVPFGNRMCSSPAPQSEWKRKAVFIPLIESSFCLFNFKMHHRHCGVLLGLKTCPLFLWCMWNDANTQSSKSSVALQASWVQIAHTSTVLRVGSLGGTKQKKIPASSTFSKHSPSYWVSPSHPRSFLFFFSWFLLRFWAVPVSPLFSSLLQLFSVAQHPASHPLTLFPSKQGESKCKAGGLGREWGG